LAYIAFPQGKDKQSKIKRGKCYESFNNRNKNEELEERGFSMNQLLSIPGDQPVSKQNALFLGDELRSLNGTFQLVLQSFDGNLVLYVNDPIGNQNPNINRAIWSPHIENRGSFFAVMQEDGNFVVYDSNHNPFFDTHTNNNQGAFIILQDDGNLVVYARDRVTPLWESKTSVAEAAGVNAGP
jgi:hypothetical protein